MTRSWRAKIIARLPWVERHHEQLPCQAYRWSKIPVRAVFTPERELYRCKRRGVWNFTALGPGDKIAPNTTPDFKAKSGSYCTQHLIMQFESTYDELDRVEAWFRDNRELVNLIKGDVNRKMIGEDPRA